LAALVLAALALVSPAAPAPSVLKDVSTFGFPDFLSTLNSSSKGWIFAPPFVGLKGVELNGVLLTGNSGTNDPSTGLAFTTTASNYVVNGFDWTATEQRPARNGICRGGLHGGLQPLGMKLKTAPGHPYLVEILALGAAAQKRAFNVVVDGQTVVKDWTILADKAANRLLRLQVPAAGESLELRFTPGTAPGADPNPAISAVALTDLTGGAWPYDPRLTRADRPAPEYRVLVFSKTLGYRHANIPLGVEAIRRLGLDNGFAVDATEDSAVFTAPNLARYKVVLLLSVTGDVFDYEQESALRNYVEGGGGFAAIHGAIFGPGACEDKWAWYGDLCCTTFKNHSAIVPGRVDAEDGANPSMAGLPARWFRADEWYNYTANPRPCARVLATVDESTYVGGTVGQDHPIAWCRRLGRGAVWYTAMGHTDASFQDPFFLQHVLGGIQLVAGAKPGEFAPRPKPAKTAGGVSAFTIEPSGDAQWTVRYGGQKLLTYAHGKFKPYVKELFTLTGANLLRDAPYDHLHHHGLMYAIRANGVNFWEETAGCGFEKPAGPPAFETEVDAQGHPQAVLRQTLHWVGPDDASLSDPAKAAILVEHRALRLGVDEAQFEVALRWQSAFEVGTKSNQVTLTGANYHGFGLRFPQELDPLAKHLNAGGAPDLNGRQDVSQHKWGSVSFNRPEQPATLVLFGHPSNARGDAWFFTMRAPFAYLSATQNLDKEPLVYRAGEKFQVNYLVALYPRLLSPEAIAARGQASETSKP
jgi:type 1 glutamine amidotransferase